MTMQYIFLGDMVAFWGTILIASLILARAHSARKAAEFIVASEAIYFVAFFLASILAPAYGVVGVFILLGAVGACVMSLVVRNLLRRATLGRVADVVIPSLLACLTLLGGALLPLFSG